MKNENFDFGSGSFVGQVSHDPNFFDTPVIEQARAMGMVNGCPVVEELIDPENTDPGRGPEEMLPRYAQVNFWFGHILRTVEKANPDLHTQLVTPVTRLDTEPLGKHEPESVPDSYFTEMAPLGTLAGYALPRLFTKQLEGGPSTTEPKERLERGLAVLDAAIPKAKTPEQLLALVAEGLSQADVPPLVVLSGTLSVGWLGEHNATGMLDRVKKALEENAPTLRDRYWHLSREEKSQYKIA